jgi:hypothetical protein
MDPANEQKRSLQQAAAHRPTPRTTRDASRGESRRSGKHHPAEMTVLLSPSSSLFLAKPSAVAKGRAAAVTCFSGPSLSVGREDQEGVAVVVGRRALASAAAVASVLGFAGRGLAANQGLLAGRVPGLSEPDENGELFFFFFFFLCSEILLNCFHDADRIVQTGWRTYRRPDDKSGGHGVGWSPIIPYSFKVPDGWDEVSTWCFFCF